MYRIYWVCLPNDTIENCAVSFTSDLRDWVCSNSGHVLKVEEINEKLVNEIDKAINALDRRLHVHIDLKKFCDLARRTQRVQTMEELFDLVVTEF